MDSGNTFPLIIYFLIMLDEILDEIVNNKLSTVLWICINGYHFKVQK